MKVKEYKKKLLINKLLIHVIRVTLLVSFVILWQIASDKEWINSFLFSSPKEIANLLMNYLSSGELFKHLRISIYETLLGLFIGTTLGVLIAIFLWRYKFISKVLDPFLIVLNALPKTALAPIFIIWVGTGVKGIVVVSISISLVVTILSAYSYFDSVDKNKIKMLESFGASKYQILTKLVLPSNLANLMGIIKINIGMSWIGVIVGEFIVSREGIGYLLTYGSQVFRLDLVMMSVFVLSIVAYLMYLLTNLIELEIRKIYNK